MQCFIALGSNLDEPLQQVLRAAEALKKLPDTLFLRLSPCYQSPALTIVSQAGSIHPDYINSVAMLETELSPFQLLKELQKIEQKQGRIRLERWGNRAIDLDIVLYGDLVITTPELTIPHVELKKRAFVLYPLSDLVPHWIFPDGENIQSLKEKCLPNGIQCIGEK